MKIVSRKGGEQRKNREKSPIFKGCILEAQ
jgi:hypothetical protein